jgi:hypothetical protein
MPINALEERQVVASSLWLMRAMAKGNIVMCMTGEWGHFNKKDQKGQTCGLGVILGWRSKKLAIVGLRCIQWHPMDCLSIKTAIQMLERKGDKLNIPPNPFVATCPIKISANILTKRLNHELEVIPKSE